MESSSYELTKEHEIAGKAGNMKRMKVLVKVNLTNIDCATSFV